MAEFPSMPVWTDALMGDTAHLDTEQFGSYFLMLMVAWRSPDNSLPVDDAQLARVCRLSLSKWRRSRDVLLAFWRVDDGRLRQKNLDKVKNSVKVNVQQKVDAGRASALKRQQTASTDVDEPLQRDAQRTSTNKNQNQEDNKEATASLFKTPAKPKETANAKPKRPKSENVPLPADWQPHERHLEKCRNLGFDVESLAEQFRNHHLARATKFANWDAAFFTWIGNATKFGGSSAGRSAGVGREPSGVVAAGLRVAARYEKKLASGV